MFQPGDILENPVTGERAIVRTSTPTDSEVDLFVRPGGAVVGEHVHSAVHERFTVLAGTLGYRLDGREGTARPGDAVDIPIRAAHDWWNAGEQEAHVRVELSGTVERFQLAIQTLWGLARDGLTDRQGRPSLLRAALIAREFDDVLVFTTPPRAVQRVVFALLAPLARLRGYEAIHPYGTPDRVEDGLAGAAEAATPAVGSA